MNINFFRNKIDSQAAKSVDKEHITLPEQPDRPEAKFNFLLFSCVTIGILGTVGALNWLIDPLWYSSGNRLTGKNFAFNERISKTNLFLRTKTQKYDCLILGSSRVTSVNASQFEQHHCFNYSFKGGEAQDFVNVSKFVKEENLDPKVIYVGVDEFNFVKKTEFTGKNEDFRNNATQSPQHAYLSANVLMFSLMTLTGASPDQTSYYDRNYEAVEAPNPPKYEARFYPPEAPQQCDLSGVRLYQEIRTIFPNAQIVGYVPPRAAWAVVNETYNRNIMDCILEGFHQVSEIYDEMYDFSVPSRMTLDPGNTFDGSHFTVQSNNEIVDVLEGRKENFGLKVNQYDLGTYRQLYKDELKGFLKSEGRAELWRN